MSRRGTAVGALALAASLAASLAMGCAAITPNPMPRYARPHPAIVEVTQDSARREGLDLVQPVRLRASDGTIIEMLIKRRAPVAGPGASATGDAAPAAALASADSAPAGPAAVQTATGRAPLVLILGGHQSGREAAELIPDARGYVIAALSYPYKQPDRRLSPLRLLRRAPEIKRAAFATPIAIEVALDWLLTQPYVDPTRVEGVGASLGAPFMTVTAAYDTRITRLWLVHAAGLHWKLLKHNTRTLIPFAPLREVADRAVYTYMAGMRFSPDVNVARVAPRPVIMINGLADERLPREAILALYDSARAPKRLIWIPGKHVQGNRPEVVRALITTILTTMQETAPNAASPPPRADGHIDGRADGRPDERPGVHAGGH